MEVARRTKDTKCEGGKGMKIVCDCGNEAEFKTVNEDTGKQNPYTEDEGQYTTVDMSRFIFWQEHDVVGIACKKCDKGIWLFT